MLIEHLLLEGLPPAESRWLARVLEPCRLHSGSAIAAGDRHRAGLLLVQSATVALVARSGSRTIEIAVVGRGHVAELIAPAAGHAVFGIQVLRGGEAIVMGAQHRAKLAANAPRFAARIVQAGAEQQRWLADAVMRTAFATARQRIAARLEELHIATEELILTATHDEFAAALALRRATVSVALQELESRHAIRTRRGSIEILDPIEISRQARRWQGS